MPAPRPDDVSAVRSPVLDDETAQDRKLRRARQRELLLAEPSADGPAAQDVVGDIEILDDPFP